MNTPDDDVLNRVSSGSYHAPHDILGLHPDGAGGWTVRARRPLAQTVTVPVGVPLPGAAAVTVAVKLTAWARTDGFTDDAITVVELSGFTTWDRDVEVLPLKIASPP